MTFTAVFIRKKLKKKEGMNSRYLYPELALLDPELTLTLPPHPTAATGIDALCHAIESYTSINASPMSEVMSLEAIRLISDNLRTAVHDGANIEAREAMLLGSLYAGDDACTPSRRTSRPACQWRRKSARTCSMISVSSWVAPASVCARVMVEKSR